MEEVHEPGNERWTLSTLRREAWARSMTLVSPARSLTRVSPDDSLNFSSSEEEEDADPITPPIPGPRRSQVHATSTADHHHRRRRHDRLWSMGDAQSVAIFEFQNVKQLVRKNFFQPRIWLDALLVMRLVVVNTAPSVLCAWVTAALYALGSPLAPFLPEWKASIRSAPVSTARDPPASNTQFDAVVGGYFVLLACTAHLAAKSFTTSTRLFTFSAGMSSLDANTPGFWRLLARNVVATGPVLVMVVTIGASSMELLRFFHVDLQPCGRMHVYILSVISYVYILFSEVQTRYKFLHQARRSLILRSSFLIVPAPLVGVTPTPAPSVGTSLPPIVKINKKKSQRMVKLRDLVRQLLQAQLISVATFHTVFVFLHVAAALPLQQRWQAVLFAAASLLLKISLQEATKKLQLDDRRQRHSARVVHTAMTVPTICIDAPVRLVFMQRGVDNHSLISSSLAIVLFEILFRMAKILRLRYLLSSRLARSRTIKRAHRRINSRTAMRDVARARAEYLRFLDWKNYQLGLHAAEVYADMHGKYISIGLAIAVLYTLRYHPRYEFGVMSSSTDTQLLAAAVQIGTGLVVDLVSNAFEGVQEVPLYESLADEGSALLSFLRLLMCVLTAINVGVIALFALRSA
ncbi:hypothetical protein BBJ28_00017908 [Nothophytophthora sp. Chile5]|nr:hypothetical protein BBJ28_00017908 [Nothophytophthora sp. Chile5]